MGAGTIGWGFAVGTWVVGRVGRVSTAKPPLSRLLPCALAMSAIELEPNLSCAASSYLSLGEGGWFSGWTLGSGAGAGG